MIRVKSILLCILLIGASLVFSNQVDAGVTPPIDNFEWMINIDGIVTDAWFDGPPSEVDQGTFDELTGLGSFSALISGVGSHYVGVLWDHDIDDPIDDEYGATSGTPAAGQSWQIGDFFDLEDNLILEAFDNTNAYPMGSENDVVTAMGWDFTLAGSETATITFSLVANSAPSGFFISQTDTVTDDIVYISSSLNVVPEPISSILFVAGGATLGLRRFRKKRKTA